MEFLNSIWIAISTPNEGLINVILFFAGFVENYLLMSLFLSILSIEANNKQKIFYVISTSLISSFSRYFIIVPFNFFFNYIMMFILIKYIFKLNIFKTVLALVSPIVIFSLVGILILNLYIKILSITNLELESIPIYRLIYIFIMYIIIFFINFMLCRKNLKIILSDDFDKKNKLIIIWNFIIGLLTLCLQTIIMFYYINTLPILFTILSFISLFAYFGISIYSLTKVTKLIQTTRALENAEEYNKTLRILHDSVRCFKHDFDNIVTAIGGYVQTDDMEGLKKYYVQLEDECEKTNNLCLLNPEVINSPSIYSLLTTKYHAADEKNIKINLSFLLDLNKLNMKIYEFARVLGILLDNSIDAANESDEKVINITFRNEEKNHRQLVIIENTYKDKNVNIDNIFNKGVSGKEEHTGLGLWEVRKILKKNGNLNLHTTKTDTYFKQQLEIYY